ncbi:MAG: hypothetical protein K9N49_05085 [Candidatus Marinimicrobia bacterium]|nr:hypothetical protein [Candidatus Neomarinimicrobiota bacterium]
MEYLVYKAGTDGPVMRPIVVSRAYAGSRMTSNRSQQAVMTRAFEDNVRFFIPLIRSIGEPEHYRFAIPDDISSIAASLAQNGKYEESLGLLFKEYKRLAKVIVHLSLSKIAHYEHNIALNYELSGQYERAITFYGLSYKHHGAPFLKEYFRRRIYRCFIQSGGTVEIPYFFL